MTTSIIGFIFCASMISLRGTQLSKQGNRLAELTGLSKALTDLFYTSAPLYEAVSARHILSILGSIAMTAVVAIGLVTRPEKKKWLLSMDSWIIIAIYILILLILE